MTDSEYYIELSILSTVLFSYHQEEHEKYFDEIELKDDWFLNPFHKLVVRAINYNKSKNIPYQEEYICDILGKYNQLNTDLWLKIISANPFSPYLFKRYLEQLKAPKLSEHQGI